MCQNKSCMEEVYKAEVECLRKTLREKTNENMIILNYIQYLLNNFSIELEQGFGKAVLEGQASFYEKIVKEC